MPRKPKIEWPCIESLTAIEIVYLVLCFFGNISLSRDSEIPPTTPAEKLIVNPKNKEALSAPGKRGFLTSPMQSVQLILNFTIIPLKEPNLKNESRNRF